MDFVELAAISSLAVTTVHEILKLKVVPFQFASKYPVPTNILLSIASAVIAVVTNRVDLVDLHDWVIFVGVVSVVAAVTYNNLVGRWAELKSMEG